MLEGIGLSKLAIAGAPKVANVISAQFTKWGQEAAANYTKGFFEHWANDGTALAQRPAIQQAIEDIGTLITHSGVECDRLSSNPQRLRI